MMSAYLQSLPEHLGHAEQAALKRSGDPASMRRLVETNLRYAVSYLKKVGVRPMTFDMVQAANLGLCEAARAWDPDKGRFTTYARFHIMNQVVRELNHQRTVMTMGRSNAALRIAVGLNKAEDELEKALGRAPTYEETAARIGVTRRELEEFLALIATSTASMDAERDDSDKSNLHDVLFTPATSMPDRIDARHIVGALRDFAEGLSGLERAVWVDRLIAEVPRTQISIAEEYGYCAGTVLRREKDLRRRFKEWSADLPFKIPPIPLIPRRKEE